MNSSPHYTCYGPSQSSTTSWDGPAGRRQRPARPGPAALWPRRAVALDAVALEEEGKVLLGGSGVAFTKLGIGARSGGDTTYWNECQWDDRKLKAAKRAFDASIDSRINFFDAAEVYGAGILGAINSESLLLKILRGFETGITMEVNDINIGTALLVLQNLSEINGIVFCASRIFRAAVDWSANYISQLYEDRWTSEAPSPQQRARYFL